jgi:hypothetical protein
MKNKTVTGRELEGALIEERMDPANVGFLVGLVKKGDNAGEVQLSQTGCNDWISVPTKMIQSSKTVGNASCGKTRYPVVLIELSPAKDPYAIVAYKLLSQLHTATKGEKSSQEGDCSETSSEKRLTSRNIGGLGQFGLGINAGCGFRFECSDCTRCIPFTDTCWSSTCCDLVEVECTIGT